MDPELQIFKYDLLFFKIKIPKKFQMMHQNNRQIMIFLTQLAQTI